LSDRWWRRRKRFDPSFDDFSEESDYVEEMMRRVFEKPSEKDKQRKSNVYGFSTNVGPDGKPQIRGFGNTQTRFEPTQIREEEPLIDVFQYESDVFMVVELLGVDKRDIQIHSTETGLTISVETPERRYYKEIALPVKVDPKSAISSYKNGVLELHLKRF
jgi:HSP20 family protein